MQYEFRGGKIYQDGNEVYSVNTVQGSLGSRAVEITGQQTISIQRTGGVYKIMQNDMDMGSISRGLRMNYNGRNYSITAFSSDGMNRVSNLLSDGTKVGTITISGDSLIGVCDFMNDEVPLIIYLSLLSPYINRLGPQPGNMQNNRANMYRMSRGYLIASNLVFVLAIIFIFAGSFILPKSIVDSHYFLYIDYGVIVIAIALSYVIRFIGRKKYREQMAQKNDDMNNNL
ncbi:MULTISPECIES: hypothetical protein [unclassified Acidiplasma]|uniref:hypothetical protein n=1 Tax=unclassified Acidiplasma TaxID=2641301 RepID=UPI0005E540B6|nr:MULTISPECIES: hypothetical protein [unclassified Acidiplasma]KJE49132.1 hypothetical protein TZ01_03290 [Acidiplasma sp. MBA-1]WMT54934.1 MAG: hypothetical protein RE470_08475 [Acidiplasma sp.]